VLAGLGLSPDPPVGRGIARERWESLEALAQLAGDFFAASPGATLGDLAAELALRSAIGQVPAMEGVTLGSLHAAKGLEWDVVFLPGLTDGTLPIIYAQSDEAIAEERRLFYVGVTRARQRLFLSWALARSAGGRRTRKPSRFLEGLRSRPLAGAAGRALEGLAGGLGRRADRRGDGRGTGRPDGRGDDEVPRDPLFTRLREWRAATAKAQDVPAYVVFSDATLLLIVGRRPASRAELAVVPGVGAVKLDRYGAAVLALCAEAGQATTGGEPGS